MPKEIKLPKFEVEFEKQSEVKYLEVGHMEERKGWWEEQTQASLSTFTSSARGKRF